MIKKFLFVTLVLLCQPTWALSFQQTEQPAPAEESQSVSFGPKRQIATIVYCGLAGAVLGLSTLSFYGRPQDYLSNIAIGFGAGVIIGTVYMTWNAATNPDEFYSPTIELEEERRLAAGGFAPSAQRPLGLSYSWDF